ncbi:cytochrome C [bacterium]|nr:cytochrome C [bacterium]
MNRLILLMTALAMVYVAHAQTRDCIDCHRDVTPGIVTEWKLSRHAENGVSCAACHIGEHTSSDDITKAGIPTPKTCAMCHGDQVTQFMAGKHSKAWVSMNAMPTAHWQPMGFMEGMKGCGGCHKIGIKTTEEIRVIKQDNLGYGLASCDVCHTRHQFSVREALAPQACRTCHMGIDHPQWEMYSSSKHGVRALLKQNGILPPDTAAPTCQYCHMNQGNHAVRTAWGFLAVRLPMPEDKQWAGDRATILKALGVLDPQGNPTARLEAVKAADIARLTEEDFQKERERMVSVCVDCHSEKFARNELAKGDAMIVRADSLMAEGINIVADLYTSLVRVKPEYYGYSYPDVLTFHDAPTVIEQKLFLMYLEHRMRTFQGAFHMNPDYSFWYGWSEMVRDLTEIRERSEEMRKR